MPPSFDDAAAGGDHRASLRLLFRSIRDNDSAALLFTLFVTANDDSIVKRSDIHIRRLPNVYRNGCRLVAR